MLYLSIRRERERERERVELVLTNALLEVRLW
jgi:hypothetical protein